MQKMLATVQLPIYNYNRLQRKPSTLEYKPVLKIRLWSCGPSAIGIPLPVVWSGTAYYTLTTARYRMKKNHNYLLPFFMPPGPPHYSENVLVVW